MTELWTIPNNHVIGEIAERIPVDFLLPVNESEFSNLSYSVISGQLPAGLRIEGNKIVGTPFEVSRVQEYRFVIRAKFDGGVSDRTFKMAVGGPDAPRWITAPGELPIGNNGTFYILDSSYVDFHLSAIDNDIAAGQQLKYSVLDDDGSLPPGLMLTPEGRIVGFVDPLFEIPRNIDNGNYDTSTFDTITFDLSFRTSNGFDRWTYDFVTYDLATKALLPNKLNRHYKFKVTLSDGDSVSTRTFSIFVVGEDHFRVDSLVHKVGEGSFTADTSYVKAPIWITPNYLGYRRADNFHVLKLDTFIDPAETGPVVYTLNTVNNDTKVKIISKTPNENKSGQTVVRVKKISGATPVRGFKIQLSRYVKGSTYTTYNVTKVDTVNESEYILTLQYPLENSIPENTFMHIGTGSTLPPGMQFDTGTGEIAGVIPYQPAVVKNYRFTITATRVSDTAEVAYTDRMFNVDIAGEIQDTLTWVSPNDLGEIKTDMISTLYVEAKTNLLNTVLYYKLEKGKMPPGLSLNPDGEIVGKVDRRASSYHTLGITSFEEGFSIDGGNTTIDLTYTFTIKAYDLLGTVSDTKEFVLRVDASDEVVYSNLIVKPFLKPTQRAAFYEFITNANIFEANSIYRLTDQNFGVQKELKMLIYAGIEMQTAGALVDLVSRNHKEKRFKAGELKIAVAKQPGTNTVLYEVVYLDVIDPLEIGKMHLADQFSFLTGHQAITVDNSGEFYTTTETDGQTFERPDPFLVTLDNTNIYISDPENSLRYPSSVSIWRKRIKSLGITERNFLPLWMRSIQPGTVNELGYVKAIPICYCKPGHSAGILNNILHSDFDFKNLDLSVDRYIVNRIDGYNFDKYIAFNNHRTSI